MRQVYHPMPFVEINYVNRKLHPDCVHSLRGRYPKSLASRKILGRLTQEALHSSPGSIRQLDLRGQNGLLGAIQKVILQGALDFRDQLSLATLSTHHNDHDEDHSNYSQYNT